MLVAPVLRIQDSRQKVIDTYKKDYAINWQEKNNNSLRNIFTS